ncbi:hypothetical protein [uncultured Sneathia sp.]|uniref:hypothetical protein n=1 Tax=uncultured Sneathia sp. TaxID=278067 RepID=UPI002596A900|nr:hypothetical protein [uncultured Sneathia sp.]
MKTILKQMKEISNILILIFFLILLFLKYYYIEKPIGNIYITVGGLLLTVVSYLYFNNILNELNIEKKYKYIYLVILVYANIISTIINASSYISDMVYISDTFRYIVIFSKITYVLISLYLVNEAFTKKKYRTLSVLFFFVSYLNVWEIFVKYEAVLAIIAILLNYGLERYGRIINKKKENNK